MSDYPFIIFSLVILHYSSHKRVHLFHCITGIVIVCDFLCNLMALVCQETKGLLTYFLTYLLMNEYVCMNNTTAADELQAFF